MTFIYSLVTETLLHLSQTVRKTFWLNRKQSFTQHDPDSIVSVSLDREIAVEMLGVFVIEVFNGSIGLKEENWAAWLENIAVSFARQKCNGE